MRTTSGNRRIRTDGPGRSSLQLRISSSFLVHAYKIRASASYKVCVLGIRCLAGFESGARVYVSAPPKSSLVQSPADSCAGVTSVRIVVN